MQADMPTSAIVRAADGQEVFDFPRASRGARGGVRNVLCGDVPVVRRPAAGPADAVTAGRTSVEGRTYAVSRIYCRTWLRWPWRFSSALACRRPRNRRSPTKPAVRSPWAAIARPKHTVHEALGTIPGEAMQTECPPGMAPIAGGGLLPLAAIRPGPRQLRKARRLLDGQRQLHPERGVHEAASGDGLVAGTRSSWPRPPRPRTAAAPPGLVDEDIPAEGLSLPEQADRLELLVLRAQLVDLREAHASPPDRKRRWSPLRHRPKPVAADAKAPGNWRKPRPRSCSAWPAVGKAEGNPKQAVDILRAVALPPHGGLVNPRVEELRAEAARILRRAKLFPEEAAFGKRCWTPQGFRRSSPTGAWPTIERLNVVAGIHFDRAETLHLAGTAADTVKQELAHERKGLPPGPRDFNRQLPANLHTKGRTRRDHDGLAARPAANPPDAGRVEQETGILA